MMSGACIVTAGIPSEDSGTFLLRFLELFPRVVGGIVSNGSIFLFEKTMLPMMVTDSFEVPRCTTTG